MRVRPAGREACNCASPYNSILERLDAMQAEILTAMQEANTAVGIANTALAQVQAAGIRTVNQIQPDADGEFSITAGTGIQINAGTNGIEIENISEGAVYTGVSPITVNENNEISLEGWHIYPKTDWSDLFDTSKGWYEAKEDLQLVIYHYLGARQSSLFIPANMRLNTSTSVPPIVLLAYIGTDLGGEGFCMNNPNMVTANRIEVRYKTWDNYVSGSGSGINETFTVKTGSTGYTNISYYKITDISQLTTGYHAAIYTRSIHE